MDGQGDVHLGDFGMALRLPQGQHMLKGHTFRGKPHYSAPEKVRGPTGITT